MNAKLILVLIFTVLSMESCSKSDFPEFALLGDLRVLTIQATADQGEVNPGTAVTLQPVISDLNGGGRNLNVTVTTCADPGVALGAQAICPNPDSTTSSSFLASTLGANNTFTGIAPTFVVNVPAAPSNYVDAPPFQQFNGVAYLVVYNISGANGDSVTAFKRIIVSSPAKVTKNKNPAIANVTDNGVALVTIGNNVYSEATANLVPSYSVGAEAYQIMNPDGSLSNEAETLTSVWFYTDGSMEFQRTQGTDQNQWLPPAKPAGRGAAVVLVTNDGRGGEGFQVFQFN